jgi:NDP-sugar pyrophosphorylase family protein
VVLAAGMARRYGRLKQLDPVGPDGEAIMDYNVWDARSAGFQRVVLVARQEIESQIVDHVQEVIGDTIPVSICHQDLDLLPDGYTAPPDRRQPWGTGHAVLCAARLLDGPFAVCNADDLYGPDGFRELARFLQADPPPTEAALVGYTLAQTLTGAGRVSRGLCVLGRDRLLETLTEIQNIRMVDRWITGTDPTGEVVELRGHEVVSMNLWGFTPPVVDLLRRQFIRFLESWGASTEAEFRLSTAINGQIRIGATRCQVLHADDQWFGMTHPDDHQEAVELLARQVDEGIYPPRLAEAFRS